MKSRIGLAIVLCLTLGLAPFVPEPHLVKQAQNLIHGRPMAFMDFVDVLVHGAPWGYLLFLIWSALRPGRSAGE